MTKTIYLTIPFLGYFPRIEARKKITKYHNLLDKIVENKFESMKTGELDKKISNKSADLLDCMIHASNDPENPTLTSEELRVRIIICKSAVVFLNNKFFYFYSIIWQCLWLPVMILVRKTFIIYIFMIYILIVLIKKV